MAELRVDALSGLRALIAPGAHVPPARPSPGPPADLDPSAAHVPVLRPDAAAPPREAALDLFTSAAARGAHEVLLSAERPTATLGALSREELASAMERWRARMAAHPEAVHVHLHVDEGPGRPRSHAQLWALDFVPAAVARERERSAAYATRTQGSDLLGDLVAAEVRGRERLVGYDDEAVLLAPYASQVPYQLVLVPRTPAPRFEAPGPLGAGLLHRALNALAAHAGAPPPLALWVRTAPRGAAHFCWRIDVQPQLLAPDGLALGTGVALNPVSPEQAAAELRPLL